LAIPCAFGLPGFHIAFDPTRERKGAIEVPVTLEIDVATELTYATGLSHDVKSAECSDKATGR